MIALKKIRQKTDDSSSYHQSEWYERYVAPGQHSVVCRHEPTTPEALTIPSDETVTVIDPRHPLYGRTLPLIHITNKQHRGQCCIVWLYTGYDQGIPLAATDRAPEPPTIFPVPLCLTAMQQLVTRWQQLMAQSVEEMGDGEQGNRAPTASGTRRDDPVEGSERTGCDPTGSGMASFDQPATTPGGTLFGQDGTPVSSTGHDAGGSQ
jgi:hypothetical protein